MKAGHDPSDYTGRIEHALRVERFLTWLGWLVAALGVAGIAYEIICAALGITSWSRAVLAALGILGVTVLSGATAYASGTNVGLAAVRLNRDLTT